MWRGRTQMVRPNIIYPASTYLPVVVNIHTCPIPSILWVCSQDGFCLWGICSRNPRHTEWQIRPWFWTRISLFQTAYRHIGYPMQNPPSFHVREWTCHFKSIRKSLLRSSARISSENSGMWIPHRMWTYPLGFPNLVGQTIKWIFSLGQHFILLI